MNGDQYAAGPAAVAPSTGVKKPGGCFRKGCGCLGIGVALCIVLMLLPLSCGGTKPDAFAYFPSQTVVAYRSDLVEFAGGRIDPELAVEFRTWVLGFAKGANQPVKSIVQVSLDHKLSQAVILEVPSSAAVVEVARKGSLRTEQAGNTTVYLIDNRPSTPETLAVAAISDTAVAAGEAGAVRQVLAVASGREKSLFDTRKDLRPLLDAYASSQVVLFKFQPLEIAEGAGCFGSLFGGGNPLYSLVGVRGQAFGSRKDAQRCEASIAFQYNSRVPSTVVSSVFGVFSALNTIPVGIPPELGSPIAMDAEQDSGLAMLTASFDVKKCEEVDRKNRENPDPPRDGTTDRSKAKKKSRRKHRRAS